MNKIVNMNIAPKSLFKMWLDITASFHKLKQGEQNILALLLYHHYKLKQDITNNKILYKVLFDYDTKHEIAEELGINTQVIRNALTVFRKKGIIVNNTLSNAIIPQFTKKDKEFKIIFNFNLIHEQ